MLPTTYPISSSGQAQSRFGEPWPRVSVTLPARSRELPGKSARSESTMDCSRPVTAVMATKRAARRSMSPLADRRTVGLADRTSMRNAAVRLSLIIEPHGRLISDHERGTAPHEPHRLLPQEVEAPARLG